MTLSLKQDASTQVRAWNLIISCDIGLDLRYENGQIVTDHAARASSDRSLYGIKKMMKEDPERAWNLKDRVIKKHLPHIINQEE